MPIDVETELLDQRERIAKIETCVAGLVTDIAVIKGSTMSTEIIIKWVVLPLIVILGGLIGIKIALPSA